MTLKRQPVQIVEIDIGYCGNDYGTGACTAVLGTDGVRKCYNTYFTCQDKPNFAPATKTLRFAQNTAGLPPEHRIYPALAGPVSTNPAWVNLGGNSERSTALGKRARVTVKLKDFRDSDIGLDKYQAERKSGAAQTDEGGYNPMDRGTFFGKLRRRWPYYAGRAFRFLEGYAGDSLAIMRTHSYVISEWDGPDADGNITIVAKDVLDLADSKRALCPKPSRGQLATGITAVFTGDVALEPAGVGAEYATSGRLSVGSEIMTFTRSGDTLTIVARGVDGSDAAAHSAGDLAQQCYHVSGATVDAVAADLLENYADISAGFIPSVDWAAETSRWMAGFALTRTIAKPTGVANLIGELSQLGCMFWWDDVAQEVKFKPNRPLDLGESAFGVSDANDILEGTTGNEDLQDKRLSRVLFWHGVIDSTGSTTSGENYRRLHVAIDEEAEQAQEYDQTQVLEIYSPWLGDGNDSIAAAVAKRLLNRYRDTPRKVEFLADIKHIDSLGVAELIEVTSRVLQDETGASLPTQMQITSVEEVVSGHRIKVTAEDFRFSGRYGFITENGRGDYAASTTAQKQVGTYIVGGSLLFGDGTAPYLMF